MERSVTMAYLLELDRAKVVVGEVLTATTVGDIDRRAVGLTADALEAVELRHQVVVVVEVTGGAVTRDRGDHVAADPADLEVAEVGDEDVAVRRHPDALRMVE